MDFTGLSVAFFTIAGTIFVAELTDKDALLLLTLATRTRPVYIFAAGSVAFAITTTIIVSVGSALVRLVPVFWIRVAGGVIMLGYGLWTLKVIGRERGQEQVPEGKERGLVGRWGRSELAGFTTIVLSLALLDLAGDATELLTIVFVAQFKDLVLVFAAALTALVLASGVEAILGNGLRRFLSRRRIQYLSVVVFLLLGAVILLTSFA